MEIGKAFMNLQKRPFINNKGRKINGLEIKGINSNDKSKARTYMK